MVYLLINRNPVGTSVSQIGSGIIGMSSCDWSTAFATKLQDKTGRCVDILNSHPLPVPQPADYQPPYFEASDPAASYNWQGGLSFCLFL